MGRKFSSDIDRKPDARPYTLVYLLLTTGIKKSETLGIKLEHVEPGAPNGPQIFIRYRPETRCPSLYAGLSFADDRHQKERDAGNQTRTRRTGCTQWAANFHPICQPGESL